MRSIDSIIIHCSATKEGRNFTVEDIRRWHKERGFEDIGYHYVIYLDGSVHQGRAVERIGAHTKGHNAHSIGICYVGGIDMNGRAKDTRTPQQRTALCHLVAQLRAQFGHLPVYGHRDFAQKECPCFDASAEFNADEGVKGELIASRSS